MCVCTSGLEIKFYLNSIYCLHHRLLCGSSQCRALSILSVTELQADFMASFVSLPRRVLSYHLHQSLAVLRQSVDQVGSASGGHFIMVSLLAEVTTCRQGAVSGYPDILQPDESSLQPTLVGGTRGADRVNKMSCSLSSPCAT